MRLFEPLDLGRVRLRNRVVSAPMERNLAAPDGSLTDDYIAYLAERAAGGAALVFTEASYVRIDGKARVRQMGVHDDDVVPGLRRLADAVHAEGALLGIELNHGGRTAQGRISGFNCVAPSPVPCEVVGGEVPLELDDEDIQDIIECFADGARRCADAGVDVISLHAAHGYLVHQFMSPRTNLRSDKWADPSLFLNTVIRAIRAAVPEMTFGMRISAFEGVDGGLDADATYALVASAPLALLDFLDVSAGSYESPAWSVQPGEWPEGLLADHAARYRDLGLPVAVAGRINRPQTAERILAESADLVSLARALHADAGWANAVAAGRDPRPCIACNLCVDEMRTGEPIPCSVNPRVGREAQPWPAPDPSCALSVAVVGAGPSGLEAARGLAELGHRVTLFDRAAVLGGDLRLASGLHEYPEYHRILEWYEKELDRLGVDAQLSADVSEETLAQGGFDAIVVATGGRGELPDVPGIEDERVTEIRAWMRAGKPDLGDAVHVLWGADREGVAVADELVQRGKRVLIVGGQHDLAPDVGRRARILVVPRLKAHPDVNLVLEARVQAIEPHALLVKDADGERRLDASGPILVSQGVTPETTILDGLRRLGVPGVVAAGEAGGQGGYIATAVADGARVAAEVHASRTALAAA